MPTEAFVVRRARPEDVQSIAAIERAAALQPWSLNQFLSSSLRDSDGAFVIEDERLRLRGFCIFQTVVDEATLMNIAVHPDTQGAGLGTLLMRALLDELHQCGVRRCLLEVRQSNQRAIQLYRSHGFLDDGIRKDYYPGDCGREDALLMSCVLVSDS